MADNRYFENIGKNFSKWSDPYDVSQRILLFERLLQKVLSFEQAIEVGCGFGGMTDYFVRRFEDLTVLDVSEDLASGTGNQYGIPYLVGDATQLEILDNSYTVVVSSECIEHTGDPTEAVRQMYRILKPGGWLVISTPNKIWGPILKFGQFLNLRKFKDQEIFLSPHEMKQILVELGCLDIQFDGCHLLPWQIPFIKPMLRRVDRFGSKLWWITINFGIVAKKPG